MSTHTPVLLNEMLSMLSPKDGGIYFDGTFGGGGYAKAILEATNCRLISCDRDLCVKNIADSFKSIYEDRFNFAHAKFSKIKSIIESYKVKKLDGIILDLGVSSFQLSDSARGFSFMISGPLDMGMGLHNETALEVIRRYSARDLANIIYEFGEEPFSRRIAKSIKLNLGEIKSTEDLANTVRSCVRKTGKIDPATKTFQALRIFVNKEIDELRQVLAGSIDLLNHGGKIIVVSFHSLEDRIVKHFSRELVARGDIRFKLLNKKPITPSKDEILSNPRSRSAKLRGFSML
jgi:16S rRNA (cytosine1402-N4)-methyltransferase